MGFVIGRVIVIVDVESLAGQHLLRANHANLGARSFHQVSRIDAMAELAVAMGFVDLGGLALAPSTLTYPAALKSTHDNPQLFQTPRIFLPKPKGK